MNDALYGWIRRDRAVMCLEIDCGAIFDIGFHDCPSCGSSGFIPVTNVVDRAREEEAEA